MKKIDLIAFLMLLCAASQAQPGGYLGKKNEISVDAFEYFYQGSISVDYKFLFHRNFGLLLHIAPQRFNTEFDYEGSKGNTSIRSLSYGGGVLFKTPWTGMPLPLGHYFGLAFSVNASQFSDALEPTDVTRDFKLNGYTLRFIMARESRIYKGLVLDYGLCMGYTAGTVTAADSVSSPYTIFPYINLWSSESVAAPDDFKSRGNGVFGYSRFYFMPRLKIGWIF